MLWIDSWIRILQAGHIAHGNQVVFGTIDPRSAKLLRGQGPAQRENDLSFADAPGGNLPQLFHADAINLGIAVLVEIQFGDKLLGERSAGAFGKNRNLGFQIVSWLEIRFLLVALVNALVVGANAQHPIPFKEQFRSGKSREHGDAGLLYLFAKPLYKAVDRDHIVDRKST